MLPRRDAASRCSSRTGCSECGNSRCSASSLSGSSSGNSSLSGNSSENSRISGSSSGNSRISGRSSGKDRSHRCGNDHIQLNDNRSPGVDGKAGAEDKCDSFSSGDRYAYRSPFLLHTEWQQCAVSRPIENPAAPGGSDAQPVADFQENHIGRRHAETVRKIGTERCEIIA